MGWLRLRLQEWPVYAEHAARAEEPIGTQKLRRARRGSRRSVRDLRPIVSVRFGEGRAGPHQASRRLRGRVVADVDGEDAVERGLHRPVVSGSGGVYTHRSRHIRPLLGCGRDLREQQGVDITRLDVPTTKCQGEGSQVGASARANLEQPASAVREVAARRLDRALVGKRAHPARG